MSEKTRAELKEQIKIMNHNYQVIREMHEKGYQYSVCEIKRLQEELDRTRKALDVAVSELQNIDGACDDNKYTDNLYVGLDGHDTRNIALDVKKALEQINEIKGGK